MEKVALITGSAKRLGAYTATHLHSLGYKVVIHYHHSGQDAHQLCKQLNGIRPDSADCYQLDLTDLPLIEQLGEFVNHRFGRLDVLVNNASTFYPTRLTEVEITDYNDLMATNAAAPLFLTKACQQMLRRSNGVVINMCDIHASRPLQDHSVYCMAKAALLMMTYSLANELAPHIRVNAIAPGAIEWPSNGISEKDIAHVVAQVPLARKGEPADIAQAIAYLVSANYVTGQVLTVDGGRQVSASQGA